LLDQVDVPLRRGRISDLGDPVAPAEHDDEGEEQPHHGADRGEEANAEDLPHASRTLLPGGAAGGAASGDAAPAYAWVARWAARPAAAAIWSITSSVWASPTKIAS